MEMAIITTHKAQMNKLHIISVQLENPIWDVQLSRDGAEVLLFIGIHHIKGIRVMS